MYYENILQSIPKKNISSEFVDEFLLQSKKLVIVSEPIKTQCWILDFKGFNSEKLNIEEKGDFTPSWIYWWTSLAAEIGYKPFYKNSAFIFPNQEFYMDRSFRLTIGKIPQYNIDPGFMVEDICHAIGTKNWSITSGQYAIVWGVGTNYVKPFPPFFCKGAIFPICDGDGVLCIVSKRENITALTPWLGRFN